MGECRKGNWNLIQGTLVNPDEIAEHFKLNMAEIYIKQLAW